jgi:hypothetical protein
VKVTVHFLSQLTGKHRNTVKRHLTDLSPDPDGKYDSAKALQLLYVGDAGPSYSEVLRRLAVTREQVERQKKDKLEMDNQETRKQLIPVADVFEVLEGCFVAIRSRIMYSHLSDSEKDDLLLQLHALCDDDLCKLGREALLAEFRAATVAADG